MSEENKVSNEKQGNGALANVSKRFNQLSKQHSNFECFAIRKISSIKNPECKCAGGGYCYARDNDNNIVRPCEL